MNKGIKYEKKLANSLRKRGFDIVLQPGSGAGIRKGDLIVENFLFDVKMTTKNSYSLNSELLKKISQYAFRQALKPGIYLSIAGEEWVLIRAKDFLELVESENKREG